MVRKWRLCDVVDFEYFLRKDDALEDEGKIRERDLSQREAYLEDIAPALERLSLSGADERRFILRRWLEGRRREAREREAVSAPLPGELFEQGRRLLTWLFFGGGALAGGLLVLSLLSYGGRQPVNVAVFFSWAVLTQAILLLALCGWLLIGKRGDDGGMPLPHAMIARLLGRLIARGAGPAWERVPARERNNLLRSLGLVKGKGRVYGALFRWAVFAIAQVFGAGFNVGALGGTLFKVLVSDLAFGWQSTVQVGEQAVYRIVTAVSLPWSWFLPPGISHPTIDQIEGSRLVLKEGAYHLATADLVAWWPFLCLSVLFYGLLPRVVLWGVGKRRIAKALSGLRFDGIAENRLLIRLRGPLVGTAAAPGESAGRAAFGESAGGAAPGEPAAGEAIRGPGRDQRGGTGEGRPAGVSANGPYGAGSHGETPGMAPGASREPSVAESTFERGVLALVPDEIADDIPRERFHNLVATAFGLEIGSILPVAFDFGLDGKGVAAAVRDAAEGPDAALFVLREAWQPPIRETLLWFRELRELTGGEVTVYVGLIGKPSPRTLLTGVERENWETWTGQIAGLGDPGIIIERLAVDE